MKVFFITTLLVVLTAVGQAENTPSPQSTVKAPDLPAPAPAAESDLPRSQLSAGTAAQVKKLNMTQDLIMEKFGGPDLMTTDKDGIEVWMYDRSTSTRETDSAHSDSEAAKSEASEMGAYFGIPGFFGVGGSKAKTSGESATVTQGHQKTTVSGKVITFIIKFNPDKTIKETSIRQAKY